MKPTSPSCYTKKLTDACEQFSLTQLITLSYMLYGVNLAQQIQNISTKGVETLKSLMKQNFV